MLIGNVGREPEVKYYDTDQCVASFTLATTERGYTLPNGTVVPDHTDWHNIVLFKALAKYAEKYIHKGDTVGYGRAFCADKTIKVATISVGYADGYPYELSNKGYVIINNKKAKILGRVCMDQTMIDVSDIDDVKIGDTVLLYGEYKDMKLDIFEIAKIANTNVYDLICRINMRIPRVYLEGDKVVRVVDYLSTEKNYYEL